MPLDRHPGFTRIDLAVCIFILAVVPLLGISALSTSRESSRILSCQSNVKQLAYANLLYTTLFNDTLPPGGWCTRWTGDPVCDKSENQPGGWMYAILPCIEQENLYYQGDHAPDAGQKAEQIMETQRTSIPVFCCSSRRRCVPYPTRTDFYNSGAPGVMAKTDYTGNGGDGQTLTAFGNGAGMNKFTEDDWAQQPLVKDTPLVREYGTLISNGVFQRRTGVPLSAITDGLECTYLLGEKYLYPEAYQTGEAHNDDQGWDVGFDADTVAFTRHFSPGGARVMKDLPGYASPVFAFGGVHPEGFNMAMVEGEVKSISYRIAPEVHAKLGIRNDGEAPAAP